MGKPLLARLWIPLAVLVLTAAAYAATLSFEFVFDDTPQIVQSGPNLTFSRVPSYFKYHIWHYVSQYPTNYYRPLFMTWLMLNYQLFGADPMLWHASAVLHHLLATLLLYFLARRLLGNDAAAGVAALIFGVHPAHVEGVAWISGVTEPLFAIVTFATLLCYLRWREERSTATGWRWRAASICLFGIAMLTKETAVIVPLLIAAFEWIFERDEAPAGGRLRRLLDVVYPFLAIVVLYLPLRIHVLHSLSPVIRKWPLPVLLETVPYTLTWYIRQLLLPIAYSVFPAMAPVREPGLTNFSIPLLVVAAAAAGLWMLARRSRAAACATALLVIPILPVLNLSAFAFDDFLHDRYLYLPSAGFCILLAMGWERLGFKTRVAALAVVTVLLAAVTVRTSLYWKDDVTLYTRAVELAPTSSIALAYLGEELINHKRYDEALPLLRSATATFVDGNNLYSDIARCYLALGEFDKALGYVQEGIAVFPYNAHLYLNLAAIESGKGQYEEAEQHARKALKLRWRASPVESRYHAVIGAILQDKGDWAGAAVEYREELKENPDLQDVRDLLNVVTKRAEEARK